MRHHALAPAAQTEQVPNKRLLVLPILHPSIGKRGFHGEGRVVARRLLLLDNSSCVVQGPFSSVALVWAIAIDYTDKKPLVINVHSTKSEWQPPQWSGLHAEQWLTHGNK
jgi:hypothetical protein